MAAGAHRVAPDDAVAEAGGEPFDLRLDAIGHVDGRAVRHVAVGPGGLRARRGRGSGRTGSAARAARMGRSAMPPRCDVAFGRGDLVERPAEMDGRRPGAVGVGPRDRPVERPVDLEHAGPVPEPGQRPGVARSARRRRRCRSPGAASRRAARRRCGGSSASDVDAVAALDRRRPGPPARRRARRRSAANHLAPSASRRRGRARRASARSPRSPGPSRERIECAGEAGEQRPRLIGVETALGHACAPEASRPHRSGPASSGCFGGMVERRRAARR